jgi:ribosomal protein S18 acetylase RimI-like enzyme
MKMSESVKLDHEDRQEVYEYVERRGTVPTTEVFTGTLDERRALAHHVAILKRDGYLEETDDGELRIALETGEEEAFSTGEEGDFTIRPARQDDLSGIVGAIRQVTEEMTSVVAESVADELDHEDVLLRHNELESRMFFVATVGGGESLSDSESSGDRRSETDPQDEVVGWAHLHAPELEKLGHTAELTVGVVEGYRGQGIGSRLLERALEWAEENDYEKLYQSVPSTNEAAIEFFEDQGWQTEAVRENHYKLGDEYIDEVMMALVLS